MSTLKLFISYLSEAYPSSTLYFDNEDIDVVSVAFAKDQSKMCFLNMQDEPVLFCVIVKDGLYSRTRMSLGSDTEEEIKNSIDFVMKADTKNIGWKEINNWMDYCVDADGNENEPPQNNKKGNE